jgi:DNA-binding LytR/AlgR family response regulator
MNIIIGTGKSKKVISTKSIIYLEGFSNYSFIHRTNGSEFTAIWLKRWHSRLPKNFIRIHRKYLINMDSVQCINSKTVTMKNGTELEISRRQRTVLLNQKNTA